MINKKSGNARRFFAAFGRFLATCGKVILIEHQAWTLIVNSLVVSRRCTLNPSFRNKCRTPSERPMNLQEKEPFSASSFIFAITSSYCFFDAATARSLISIEIILLSPLPSATRGYISREIRDIFKTLQTILSAI